MAFDLQDFEPFLPVMRVGPTLFTAGCELLIGQEERPFRFHSFEVDQFGPFVMQSTDVFDNGLMTVPAEAFVSVGAS